MHSYALPLGIRSNILNPLESKLSFHCKVPRVGLYFQSIPITPSQTFYRKRSYHHPCISFYSMLHSIKEEERVNIKPPDNCLNEETANPEFDSFSWKELGNSPIDQFIFPQISHSFTIDNSILEAHHTLKNKLKRSGCSIERLITEYLPESQRSDFLISVLESSIEIRDLEFFGELIKLEKNGFHIKLPLRIIHKSLSLLTDVKNLRKSTLDFVTKLVRYLPEWSESKNVEKYVKMEYIFLLASIYPKKAHDMLNKNSFEYQEIIRGKFPELSILYYLTRAIIDSSFNPNPYIISFITKTRYIRLWNSFCISYLMNAKLEKRYYYKYRFPRFYENKQNNNNSCISASSSNNSSSDSNNNNTIGKKITNFFAFKNPNQNEGFESLKKIISFEQQKEVIYKNNTNNSNKSGFPDLKLFDTQYHSIIEIYYNLCWKVIEIYLIPEGDIEHIEEFYSSLPKSLFNQDRIQQDRIQAISVAEMALRGQENDRVRRDALWFDQCIHNHILKNSIEDFESHYLEYLAEGKIEIFTRSLALLIQSFSNNESAQKVFLQAIKKGYAKAEVFEAYFGRSHNLEDFEFLNKMILMYDKMDFVWTSQALAGLLQKKRAYASLDVFAVNIDNFYYDIRTIEKFTHLNLSNLGRRHTPTVQQIFNDLFISVSTGAYNDFTSPYYQRFIHKLTPKLFYYYFITSPDIGTIERMELLGIKPSKKIYQCLITTLFENQKINLAYTVTQLYIFQYPSSIKSISRTMNHIVQSKISPDSPYHRRFMELLEISQE